LIFFGRHSGTAGAAPSIRGAVTAGRPKAVRAVGTFGQTAFNPFYASEIEVFLSLFDFPFLVASSEVSPKEKRTR
jgi:hypothetical protein